MSPQFATPPTHGVFNVDLRGAHYDFLKERVPTWFYQASVQRQQELADHELYQLPTWYQAASPQARHVLDDSHNDYRVALNAMEQILDDITDVVAFAEDALKAAIKRTFNLDLDVRQVFFARKYAFKDGRADLFGAFTFDRESDPLDYATYRGMSLLEAALANFEPDEEIPSSCSDCRIITRFSGYDDYIMLTFDALKGQAVAIAPHDFAKLCRSLDLGERYQTHLKHVLRPEVESERDKVQQRLQDYWRKQLALSVEMAHLQVASVPGNGEIDSGVSDTAYTMLKRLLADTPGVTLDGRAVTFASLKIFDIQLVGPVLIGPERLDSDRVERVLVFIPNDPQQPLKEYASAAAFMKDLRTRLHSASYRRFFSRFIPTREQGTFFKQFNELYQPKRNTDASLDYPLQPRLPRLRLGETAIVGSLWEHQAARFVDKTLIDARAVAVPTGDEDLKARNERLESYEDAVVSFLNLAAFVVPGLGPVMLAVGATQMCGEVFEGIEAAEQGDVREMWAHFSSVALNAAFFAAGAKVLPSIQHVNVLDHYKPVTMPTGKQLLWKADLTPYESPVKPAPGAKPDALGLHAHEGHTLLSIEGKPYQVRPEAETGQYRIQHPTRPRAYAPKVERHPQGGWSHELEEPLTWDDATLHRRLGLADYADQVNISGVEVPTLRETFISHEPLPLVLEETIQRFEIHQQLTTFVEQMNSSDPKVYAQADPALQLDIMQRRGMLPHSAPLRVLGPRGNLLWEGAAPVSAKRLIAPMSQAEIDSGRFLDGVLYTLQGYDPALVDLPGSLHDPLAVRARLLRRYIARTVGALKGTLMDERYTAATRSTDPDVQRAQVDYPGLSTPMIAHMLEGLDAAELERFRGSGRLPTALVEQMRWCEQETRVSRAYEGLQLDSLTVIDSQRLALHTLETLPGWRSGTRVELRHYSAEGPLLDAIGAADAPLAKTLVLQEDGLFASQVAGDFYTAVWETMAAEERQLLNLSDAAQLKLAVQQSPLPRPALRTLLLEHPVHKPPYHPSMRLFGGGPGFRQLLSRTAHAMHSAQSRVRKLFPSFSDAQVSAYIESLGEQVSGGLARREAEFEALDRTLKRWVKKHAPQSPVTPSERAGGMVGRSADIIRRCWRRETGTSLRLVNGRGVTLPELSGDFSHVQALELSGFKLAGKTADFLKPFAHLKRLTLRDCQLVDFFEAVSDLHGLTTLKLESNQLFFSAIEAHALGKLTNLEELSLMGNRLGTSMDFTSLTKLKRLNLSFTQLIEWPTGLQHLGALESLDLRHNRLIEVPQAHLNPPPEQVESMARVNRVTLLENNAFASDYWQVFDGYWKRLGETRPELLQGALADAFDSGNPRVKRVQRMFPDYAPQRAREFVWKLGDGADTELTRLEREFDSLETQLNAWTFSGVGARQRYIRPGQRQVNAGAQQARHMARERIFRCWRRETPQMLANDGTPIGLELDLSGLNLPSLPDLEADFSHVGSLKLNNMHLSTSPEGFLARFRGVRWLDLSGNQLRALPPAVGEMHGLTRLFLNDNLISLSPETARILSDRVTLRALTLSDNNLGITPDFTRITDMRSLNLARAGLDSWPEGLLEQPLLDGINLSGNAITTIPDAVIAPSDEQLAHTAGVNNVTNASDNPWSDATLAAVRAYGERLERAGLASTERPNRLVNTALSAAGRSAPGGSEGAQFRRWAVGLSESEVSAREAQWASLRGQAGSQGFFEVLRDLQTTSVAHEDLQQRVWEVIDSITANSTQSERLREQMFEWAGRAACCDRAALSFSNMEVMALVDKARLQALDATQGEALSSLSKGLFRLDQVEQIALRDIDQRRLAINNDAALSPADKTLRLARLEEVEIRLAYRYGLKDRLQLPGQPVDVKFTHLGNVTPQMLDAAYTHVVALDNSASMFQTLLAREFWQDYVTQKYRSQFDAQSKPYQERMAGLHDKYTDGTLTEAVYDAQAKALQAQLAIDDAALIETLTRQEIAEHVLAKGPLEAITETGSSPFTLELAHAQAIEFEGKQYFVASMPDVGDGYYLLRVQNQANPYELVNSGIIAKPDVAGVWKRRGVKGGGSDSEFEDASESMPVAPYTAQELAFMRTAAHFSTLKNELGSYNRANNGKYPLRDLQGRPIRIRSLERKATMDSGRVYVSTPIKPYIRFEGFESVGALYEEKLQWRTFTAADVKVPGEKALVGQSMVVANRRIAKGEIVGIYGGVVIPYDMSVRSESTFGMVVGHKLIPDAGTFRPDPIFIIGDNITSRINTHFEYDAQGTPIRQATEGYNVECVPFQVEAEHATSAAGKRTTYRLNTLFATEDIPAGVELRMDYGYTERMIKTKFGGGAAG